MIYGEHLTQLFPHSLCNSFCLCFLYGVTTGSRAYSCCRHPSGFGNTSTALFILFQPCGKVNLRCGDTAAKPYPWLCKVLVKAVQVLGTDICKLQMPDCLIYADHQFLVSVKGFCLCAVPLLQIQNIGCILGEGLPVIRHISLLYTALNKAKRAFIFCIHCIV